MNIALVAPPFISVPPKAYGGTELFIANLAEALSDRGHRVVVYANGESTLRCEVRWLFERSDWPPRHPGEGALRNFHHMAWALADVNRDEFDVVHLNDTSAVPITPLVQTPAVHTLHHPHETALTELYQAHPNVSYIAISDFQRQREPMPRIQTIHHGIRIGDYQLGKSTRRYLSFLGRIAPVKGTHHAIKVARRAGIPLKIAGEIQPAFRSYWEQDIEPLVDGRMIEYIGEADAALKNELLANSVALLFPIEWDEPLGLVMLEAMACGTPVLAFPGGSVPEVVSNGVSGWICRDIDELAARACNPGISPASCRDYVIRRFSLEGMVDRYERAYEQAIDDSRPLSPSVDRESRPSVSVDA